MALTVKICGLKTPRALDVGAGMRAPTWSASCSFRRARAISGSRPRARSATRVQGRAGKVALTVDANDETLADIVEALKPDMLQLHGKRDAGARRRRCARVSACR